MILSKAEWIITLMVLSLIFIIVFACCAEDPLQKKYDRLIQKICSLYPSLENENEVLLRYDKLKLAKIKLDSVYDICCKRNKNAGNPAVKISQKDEEILKKMRKQEHLLKVQIFEILKEMERNFNTTKYLGDGYDN